MKIKKRLSRFLPYSRQSIDKKDIYEVTKTLKRDFITQGSKINEFENLIKTSIKLKTSFKLKNKTSIKQQK